MIKFLSTTIYIIIIFFLTACNSDSGEKETKKNTQSKDIVKLYNLHNLKLFDINTNSLGENFEGLDIEEVGKSLVKKVHLLKVPPKDEYETTEEYKKRIGEIDYESVIFNTTKTNPYLVFSLDPYSAFKYNADSKELEINVGITDYSLEKKIISNASVYTTTNALRQSYDVKYTDEVKYSLDLYHDIYHDKSSVLFSNKYYKDRLPYVATTPSWLFYDPIRKIKTKSNLEFSRSIKLPIEKVKKIKLFLKILFITKLESPYITQHRKTVEPTIEYLYAGERLDNKIIAQIEQVWLYDSFTGEVIKKWSE